MSQRCRNYLTSRVSRPARVARFAYVDRFSFGPTRAHRASAGSGSAADLYTQIGIILLIALSAKNAILIVEVAREHRVRGDKPLFDAAVEAAIARLRPILMTSFAFILGVVPLVIASGAGASARKSIGIAVFSGMIASTCLAVLFVPSLFVVVQRIEEWRAARKRPIEVPPQRLPLRPPGFSPARNGREFKCCRGFTLGRGEPLLQFPVGLRPATLGSFKKIDQPLGFHRFLLVTHDLPPPWSEPPSATIKR